MKLSVPKIHIERISYSEVDIVPRAHSDFLTDINNLYASYRSKYRLDYIHGRESEIEDIFTCLLLNSNNNVLLVGGNGVGKKAIIQAAVLKVLDGQCPERLEEVHFLSLETEKVEAIVNTSDKRANRQVSRLFRYLSNNTDDEIVLFIDKIHLLLHSSFLEFQLLKLLSRRNIRVIGTLTEEDLYEFYYMNHNLISYFTIIEVEEPQYSEIFDMIYENVALSAIHHGVSIADDIIRYAIALSIIFPSELSSPGNVLKNLEKAMIIASNAKHSDVTREDVKHSFNFKFDIYNGISDDEKILTAYHEAGHFIIVRMSENIRNYEAKIITIIPSDDFLGVTAFDYDVKKQTHMNVDYFIDSIASDLGGRVAEELFLGDDFKPSTGAASDLQHATQLAREIITIYGMTPVSGNMSDFCGIDILDYSLLSEKKKTDIDDEVRKIIQTAYDRAKEILQQEVKLLDAIAEELLINDVLDEFDLDRICSQVHSNN